MSHGSRRRATRQFISMASMLCLFVVLSFTGLAQTTVVYWSNHSIEDVPVFAEIIREFEAENPDIKVDWQNQADFIGAADYYTKIAVAMMSGTGPDVFFVRPGTDHVLVRQGLVYDIDPLVQRDAEEIRIDDIMPAQIGELKHNGKWWALPFDFSSIGLYYNKDLFDASGVSYPAADWTWDDLSEAARKLTHRDGNSTTQWGMHGLGWMFSQWAEGFVMSYGGRLFNDEYTESAANHPGTVAALQLPVTLIQEMQVAAPLDAPGYHNIFFAGDAAMSLGGSWAITANRRANNFDWDVSSLPLGPEGLVVSLTGGGAAMSAYTQVPEAAWKLLKTLASHETARKLLVDETRSHPSFVSLMPEWAEAIQEQGTPANALSFAQQAFDHGRPIPLVDFRFHVTIDRHHYPLVSGLISPLETAERIHREFQAELDR